MLPLLRTGRPRFFDRGRSRKHLQTRTTRRRTDAQNKEIQNIVKMVDGIAADSQRRTTSRSTWVREDVLKAQGNKEYVPFTVTVDPSKVERRTTCAFYWRVVHEERRRRRRAPPPRTRRRTRRRTTRRQEEAPTTRTKTSRFVPVRRGQNADADLALVHRARPAAYDVYIDRQRADARQGAEERAAAEGVGR